MAEGDKNPMDKEMFKIALDARNFEIKMFWQRCNYFLLLNTSVGAAFALLISGDKFPGGELDKIFTVLIPVIGIFVCFAWVKVGLGAKFWQSYWEQVLIDFQEGVGFGEAKEGEKASEDRNIFSRSAYTDIEKRVRKNLEKIEKTPESCCQKIGWFFCLLLPLRPSAGYNENIIKKPSVSRWMHRTALFFLWVWLGILLYVVYEYDIANIVLDSTKNLICNSV